MTEDDATTLAVADETTSAAAAGVAEAQSDGDTPDLLMTVDTEGAESAEGEDDASEATEEEATTAPETVEIEHDGQTYQVPAALKDSYLRWADYSQKTAKLADDRRAFEAQASQYQQNAQAVTDKQVDLALIDKQIEAYKAVDWRALFSEDPAYAAQEQFNFNELKDRRTAVEGELENAKREVAFETQRATAKRIEEGRAQLANDIPGWGDELAGKLVTYGAETFGFTPEEVANVQDPRIVRLLHAAYASQQAAEQQKKVARLKTPQQTKPAPAARGAGGRFAVSADTNDFAAFEKMVDAKLAVKG